MYNDMTISYIQLMMAVHKAETEFIDSEGNSTTSKGGIINDSQQTKIPIISNQIVNLLSMVQGSQDKGGKSKGYQSQNKGANTSTSEGGKSTNGDQNNYHFNNWTSPKPPMTSVGHFHWKKRPMQCFRCHGWGHSYEDCGTT